MSYTLTDTHSNRSGLKIARLLVYDHATDRYDIRFDLDCYYGGLHCGECFDVMIGGKWKPTRIEMAADWYLSLIHIFWITAEKLSL